MLSQYHWSAEALPFDSSTMKALSPGGSWGPPSEGLELHGDRLNISDYKQINPQQV